MDAFRASVEEEVRSILGSDFRAVVIPTETVPGPGDPDLTYPNLDAREQRVKLLESCVLHVDMRDSTRISDQHRRETLVRLYSAFVRSMARCAARYGGKVRNIVGDRVMVLFDRANCFANAVNTAILMNSVGRYVLDRHFPDNSINLGVGIDYGSMLITKTGVIKRGEETETSRSLAWLGRPANVASKLADEANKTRTWTTPTVQEGMYYPNIAEWGWSEVETSAFLTKLIETYTPVLRHPDQHFSAFFQSARYHSRSMPPILLTEAVFNGFKAAALNDDSLTKNLWRRQSLSVSGQRGAVYGGDVIFTSFRGA